MTYDSDDASPGAVSHAEAESWYVMSGCSSEASDYDQAAADVVRIAPALTACVPGVLADRAELVGLARQQVESFYDGYVASNKLASEADLIAREAYECLTEPSALSAAASQPDRLKRAHLEAKLGASTHLEAAAAARTLRGACAIYATYAFGAADKATATRVPLLVRGRDALQVVGLALSRELQHSMLAAMFTGVTKTNDPCQPLALGHSFKFASPEILESMVRRSLRPAPDLDEHGRPDQTTPESATSYQQVLDASESAAPSWQAHLDNVSAVEILINDFTEAHNKHVEWMRVFSGHFASASVTEHESLAVLKTKIVTAVQQSLLADVPPELPGAQAHLLAAASLAVTTAASTYALHLEHLILIAFATSQGHLPDMPQNIEMPAVLRYFTSSADSVSNARNVHTNVLAARDKIADLLGKLISAFQEVQRIPAFRFKDLSEL
ncbi:MAG: hypothetical protein I8H77_18100 [Comamonadaceae bacterium]|nr:hypothetical protein [Comamonadaceae bacterium]